MNPQDKALELYLLYFNNAVDFNIENSTTIAKQSALIAVQEIVHAFNKFSDEVFYRATNEIHLDDQQKYWQQVKKQIEIL